jgi:hypothetical protein
VADVDIRRGGVEPELQLQGLARLLRLLQFRPQFILRDDLERSALDEFDLLID